MKISLSKRSSKENKSHVYNSKQVCVWAQAKNNISVLQKRSGGIPLSEELQGIGWKTGKHAPEVKMKRVYWSMNMHTYTWGYLNLPLIVAGSLRRTMWCFNLEDGQTLKVFSIFINRNWPPPSGSLYWGEIWSKGAQHLKAKANITLNTIPPSKGNR